MARQGSKKKSPMALLLLVFAAIVIVMFIANYRSAIVEELRNPRSGVKKLSTYGKQLIAISPDNEIYIWDWDDLSNWPQTGSVNAQKVVAMSGKRILWIGCGIDDVLIVGNLKGDKELNRLSLDFDKKCKLLQASPNGKFAAAALANDSFDNQIQLAVIDPNSNAIRPVKTTTLKDGLKLNDIGISNNGTLVAAVGGGDKGWLFVAGANDKQLLREYYVEDCNELNNVVISPDGQTIYTSEPGRRVYVFDISAEKIVKRLEMDKYETKTKYPQTITCMALSPDGHLIAAVSSPMPRVYIWDANTGEKITIIKIGNFPISSIAFSPDSSLLAEAISANRPIKVWRILKSH